MSTQLHGIIGMQLKTGAESPGSFLHSRCSMEMYLPRVGWRVLACENGASPDCIYCCCFRIGLTEQTVYVNMSLRTNWQQPSSTHRCECSRAEKWALDVHADGARKIGCHKHSNKVAVSASLDPGRVQTGMSTTLSKRQQQLREIYSFLHCHDQDLLQLDCPLTPAMS